MKCAIMYSSITGNTKLMAEALQNWLQEECSYCGKIDANQSDVDILFLGSWCDKGRFSDEMIEFMQTLQNKKIILFGTAGYGAEQSYFDGILERSKKYLNHTNEVLSSFMCQGKMPLKVKEIYQKKQKEDPTNKQAIFMLQNFENALSHPNESDIQSMKQTFSSVLNKLHTN